MISRELYFNQVKEILKANNSLNVKEFENLYSFYLNGADSNEIDKTLLCDIIVKKLFDSSLYTSLLVPWNFLDTEVGKVLISVKFGQENSGIFFVSEVTELLGKKQQYISREIKEGKLRAYKRGGKVIIYRQDLDKYIRDKGLDIKEYKQLEEKILTPGYERTEKYGED